MSHAATARITPSVAVNVTLGGVTRNRPSIEGSVSMHGCKGWAHAALRRRLRAAGVQGPADPATAHGDPVPCHALARRREASTDSHAYCVGKIHHARPATLPTAASCGRAAFQVARGARCRSGARIALSCLRLGGRIAALGIGIGGLNT